MKLGLIVAILVIAGLPLCAEAQQPSAAKAKADGGVFKSVDELKQAIMDYLDNHNGHPKPYIWTKTATEIFSKVARAKQVGITTLDGPGARSGYQGR